MKFKYRKYLLIAICAFLINCMDSTEEKYEESFDVVFKKYNIDGVFAVFDENEKRTYISNEVEYNKQYIPSSTFSLCNAIIALSTGALDNPNQILKWDSVEHFHKSWNKDSDLKHAIENSTYWYFQECARRVGADKMKTWLDNLNYGNNDTSGGVDQFWKDGGLRISPKEQLDFFKKLRNNELPVDKNIQDVVKELMVTEAHPTYLLHSISGWGVQNSEDIGWYIGCVETNDNCFIFVNCIRSTDSDFEKFVKYRKEIAIEILQKKGIIPTKESKKDPIKVSSF